MFTRFRQLQSSFRFFAVAKRTSAVVATVFASASTTFAKTTTTTVIAAPTPNSAPSSAASPVAPPAPETSTAPENKTLVDKAADSVRDTTQSVSKTLGETRERREKANGYVLGNYSPIDFLLPSKIGATIGYIPNADRTYELEYLRGNVAIPFLVKDLGAMTEQRISLITRSYGLSNSFNFSYGLSYFDFTLHIGDSLLNKLSSGVYPSIDLVQVQALGFNVAIGNRWTFNHNVTLGLDWISWSQPVVVTSKKSAFLDYATNADDKNNVDTALKVISYFPRLAFFKFQLGMLF